jgi:hypothetical protein
MSDLTIHDVEEEQFTVSTNYSMAEIQRVADYAKARHNEGYQTALGGDKLVASVHPAVIHQWCNARGITMSQFMCDSKLSKQFLEDPDNAAFRVWKGAI